MAKATIQLRGFFEDLISGSKSISPADLVHTTPPLAETQLVLASGDNTITVPSTAVGCIILFDPTSTAIKKLKGAGGDTGIIVSRQLWIVLTFDTTPIANFIINSSVVDTGKTTTVVFF